MQEHLSNVAECVQADATHMNFGKYTLYLVYGNTANAIMSPMAFTFTFGNKDYAGCTMFWNFAVKIHPTLNLSEITIITDQDKGQIAAIAECVPNAFHFHCNVHHQQIISRKFLSKTDKPLSCQWMFDQLTDRKTHLEVLKLQEKYLDKMSKNAVAYLGEGLTNQCQFQAS